MFRKFCTGFALACVCGGAVADTDSAEFDIDITQSSIEELLNVRVVTASRRPEPVSRSPAAVYVLSADDIQRSGATSIPEALRLVPGVQVARIDANKWAVSIRGFNSRTANKLLVLVDGRTIYDPLFTGVLWETKDVMLEDVARIEVVRGPGGALWGANAVNGVINIITKSARRTLGGLVTASVGSEERLASMRYGFEIGETAGLRLYVRRVDRHSGYQDAGTPNDEASLVQAGFRFDSRSGERDSLTIQGDIFDAEQGAPASPTYPDAQTAGTNVLGRWIRELENGGRLTLQGFYESTDYEFGVLDEVRDTFDAEIQHTLHRMGSHSWSWGITYRDTSDEIVGTPLISLDPDSRQDTLVGIYVHDDIELITETLYLTLGAKYESNDYTGSNVQPNVRVGWQIDDRQFLWASVARAVRTPSRLEHDFLIPLGGGVEFRGNRTMDDELLTATEIGYRLQPNPEMLFDIAMFVNSYDDLMTTEGLILGNGAHGDVSGFELTTTYIPSDRWQLTGGYSYLDMDLEFDADSIASVADIARIVGSSPNNQAFVRASFTPGPRLTIDAAVRYVDELPYQDVDSYVVSDVGIVWSVTDNLQLSLYGRNLFESHHQEQGGSANTSEVEDSLRVKLRYVF